MLRELLETYKKLRRQHFQILRIMEKNLTRFEYVPLQYLAKKTRIKKDKLERILDFMVREKILKKNVGGYKGYALTYRAMDILAMRDLEFLGLITSVERKIGVGKEGEIWIAYFGSIPRIVKFYRMGKESFKKAKKHRFYYIDDSVKNWFLASIRSAKREYTALRVLYDNGVKVPEPLASNRHVIVMDYIDGKELVKTIIDEPIIVFRNIIYEVFKAYKVGFIHADLSEFNVMVNEEGDVYLIDWPQYVTPNSPLADEYLRRDIENIVRYFVRKYRLGEDFLLGVVEEIQKMVMD